MSKRIPRDGDRSPPAQRVKRARYSTSSGFGEGDDSSCHSRSPSPERRHHNTYAAPLAYRPAPIHRVQRAQHVAPRCPTYAELSDDDNYISQARYPGVHYFPPGDIRPSTSSGRSHHRQQRSLIDDQRGGYYTRSHEQHRRQHDEFRDYPPRLHPATGELDPLRHGSAFTLAPGRAVAINRPRPRRNETITTYEPDSNQSNEGRRGEKDEGSPNPARDGSISPELSPQESNDEGQQSGMDTEPQQRSPSRESVMSNPEDAFTSMTEAHRECLRKNRVELVQNMNIGPVLHYLFAADILTELEEEEIAKEGPIGLLRILPKRTEKAFKKYREALNKTKQPALAALLAEPGAAVSDRAQTDNSSKSKKKESESPSSDTSKTPTKKSQTQQPQAALSYVPNEDDLGSQDIPHSSSKSRDEQINVSKQSAKTRTLPSEETLELEYEVHPRPSTSSNYAGNVGYEEDGLPSRVRRNAQTAGEFEFEPILSSAAHSAGRRVQEHFQSLEDGDLVAHGDRRSDLRYVRSEHREHVQYSDYDPVEQGRTLRSSRQGPEHLGSRDEYISSRREDVLDLDEDVSPRLRRRRHPVHGQVDPIDDEIIGRDSHGRRRTLYEESRRLCPPGCVDCTRRPIDPMYQTPRPAPRLRQRRSSNFHRYRDPDHTRESRESGSGTARDFLPETPYSDEEDDDQMHYGPPVQHRVHQRRTHAPHQQRYEPVYEDEEQVYQSSRPSVRRHGHTDAFVEYDGYDDPARSNRARSRFEQHQEVTTSRRSSNVHHNPRPPQQRSHEQTAMNAPLPQGPLGRRRSTHGRPEQGRTVSLIAHVQGVEEADVQGEADSTQRVAPRTTRQIEENFERNLLELAELGIENISRRYREGIPVQILQQEVDFFNELTSMGKRVTGAKKDSIKLELSCPSQEAVDDLLHKVESGYMLDLFNKTFANELQKQRFGAKEVNFTVALYEDEYKKCRKDLPRRGDAHSPEQRLSPPRTRSWSRNSSAQRPQPKMVEVQPLLASPVKPKKAEPAFKVRNTPRKNVAKVEPIRKVARVRPMIFAEQQKNEDYPAAHTRSRAASTLNLCKEEIQDCVPIKHFTHEGRSQLRGVALMGY